MKYKHVNDADVDLFEFANPKTAIFNIVHVWNKLNIIGKILLMPLVAVHEIAVSVAVNLLLSPIWLILALCYIGKKCFVKGVKDED